MTPPAHEAEVAGMLAFWTRAGLLGNVVLCAQTDRFARCQYSIGTEWREESLWTVIGKAGYRTVTVAMLRPDGPPADPDRIDREQRIMDDLRRPFAGTEVQVRAVTVGVANPDAPAGDRSFSPQWDLHLLHDLNMVSHIEAAKLAVGAEDQAGLCTMTALLVGGGWVFSREPWDLTDQADGNTKPFRIVRPQIRILFAGALRTRVSAGVTPTAAPWPEPEGVDTIRAGTDIDVPGYLAGALARLCEFTCPSATIPTEDDPRFLGKLRGAVRLLGKPLPPPRMPDRVEQALVRLAGMTGPPQTGGGNTPGRATMPADETNLSAYRVSELPTLIRRAEMPGLAMGRIGTPETWERMRRTLYGLVDASAMPEGLKPPPPPTGAESRLRPVWSDPHRVAPPPDAEPFDLDTDLAAELGVDRIEAIDVANCRAAHRLISVGTPSPPTGDGGEDGSERSGASDRDDFRARWTAWLERWRWTPLWILADRLGAALEDAHTGFLRHTTRVRSDEEHRAAVRARRKLRRAGLSFLVLAVVAGLLVLERHVGMIGSMLRFVIGDRTSTYLDVLVLAGFCALAAGILGALYRRVVITTLDFEKAERLRAHHSRVSLQYAAELIRLQTAAAEFNDHQQVIRTMLHQPFGSPADYRDHRRPWLSEHAVPHSMMIATAEADPAKLADVRKELSHGVMSRGWLDRAHGFAMELWQPRFSQLVTTGFDSPDEDNSPPGAEFSRDPVTRDAIPFPREHFRAVVAETGLRRAVRVKLSFEVIGVRFDPERILAPVVIEHGPEIPGAMAETFLDLPEPSEVDWFDTEILTKTASGKARRPSEVLTSGERVEIPDGDRDETILVSWRVPLSDPIEPRYLAGWHPEEDDPDPDPGATSVV